MGAETRLHRDDALRQLLKGGSQSQTLDLPAQDHLPGAVETDQMKPVLADVDADHRKVLESADFFVPMAASPVTRMIPDRDNPTVGEAAGTSQ